MWRFPYRLPLHGRRFEVPLRLHVGPLVHDQPGALACQHPQQGRPAQSRGQETAGLLPGARHPDPPDIWREPEPVRFRGQVPQPLRGPGQGVGRLLPGQVLSSGHQRRGEHW